MNKKTTKKPSKNELRIAELEELLKEEKTSKDNALLQLKAVVPVLSVLAKHNADLEPLASATRQTITDLQHGKQKIWVTNVCGINICGVNSPSGFPW